MSVENQLLTKLHQYKNRELTDSVIDRIKTILLHDLVIAKRGKCNSYYEVIQELYDENRFLDRLFLQGMAMSADASEDFYGANHFGPLIIPNVLYFAEKNNKSGAEVLNALVAGFEFGIDLADQYGGGVAAKGFRGTPLFGVLAATLASSILSNYDDYKILTSLSHAYANTFGIGISLVEGTDEWRYQAALGAYHAGLAACLSNKGLKGRSLPFSGASGFVDVFAKPSDQAFNRPAGSTLLQVGVKRHPVHIFVLSPVEAIQRLIQKEGPLHVDVIQTVKVSVPEHQLVSLNENKGPYVEENQAITSIPTNVALTLIYQNQLAELLKYANDQKVVALVNKVEIIKDADLRDYEAKVEVVSEGRSYYMEVKCSEELYFTSFTNEREMLIAEAKQRGESTDYIIRLSKEIEDLENQASVSSLLATYHE